MVNADLEQTPLLSMRGIVKQFPGARALDGVDLDVVPGEVHCLLGQNGAGKSTLIKILSGAHQPTEGEILLDGEPVTIPHPVAGLRLGVATIYQELDVVDGLTVAENVFLGHELATAGVSRRREAAKRTREILKSLGHTEISPHREVSRLSAAGKQIVSMARALSHDARVIVMDARGRDLLADRCRARWPHCSGAPARRLRAVCGRSRHPRLHLPLPSGQRRPGTPPQA